MKKIAGINGFGRFGLHLLKYWLDRASSSNFNIGYINDDTITIDQALETLNNDNKVKAFVSFFSVSLFFNINRFITSHQELF